MLPPPPLNFALLTSCLPAGCHVAPVVAPPPPLVLSSHCLCLATAAPPPFDARPPPPVAPRPPLVPWRLSSCLPLVHRLVVMSHLVMPPPHAHVSILDPCLHVHWLVVPSHLVALPTSRRRLTSLLPLIRSNWLPVCLTWYA